LASSMIFLFLYNLLYSGLPGFTGIAGNITTGKITKTLCKPLFHSVLISLLVSVIASMVIWLLFSYIFKIALP
jgi:hypothetical protein